MSYKLHQILAALSLTVLLSTAGCYSVLHPRSMEAGDGSGAALRYYKQYYRDRPSEAAAPGDAEESGQAAGVNGS